MSSAIEEDAEAAVELERAGPYRLIRKLGRGGMGQVFLGVRDDEAFKRYVAVKVIRRGMDTDDILKRFRVERRILASLNHPGIAQLLDGAAPRLVRLLPRASGIRQGRPRRRGLAWIPPPRWHGLTAFQM